MAAGVKCSVAALQSFPVLHQGADYIFWSFGINEHILGYFEYTVSLSLEDLLGGMNSVVFTTTIHEQTQSGQNKIYMWFLFHAKKF